MQDSLIFLDKNINNINELISSIKDEKKFQNKELITSTNEEINNTIKKVFSLYPSSKFDNANEILNNIKRSIENDDDYSSFSTFKNDLLASVNSVISYFNSHYWQITGIKDHGLGREPSKVSTLADPIKTIG